MLRQGGDDLATRRHSETDPSTTTVPSDADDPTPERRADRSGHPLQSPLWRSSSLVDVARFRPLSLRGDVLPSLVCRRPRLSMVPQLSPLSEMPFAGEPFNGEAKETLQTALMLSLPICEVPASPCSLLRGLAAPSRCDARVVDCFWNEERTFTGLALAMGRISCDALVPVLPVATQSSGRPHKVLTSRQSRPRLDSSCRPLPLIPNP